MESRRLVLVFRSPTHATGEGAGDLQHPNNNCTPLQCNAPHSVYTVQCSLQCTVQCNHPLQFTAPHCTLCPVFTVQCNNISKLPRCNPMHFMFSISTNNINKLTALQHAFFLLLLCTALMSLCHSWIVLQFFNNSVFDPNKQ